MASSKKFQAPRGTRDFYPADMAVRRYIESVWRTTSINHGFEEVEGPTIEHLDLYTHKSGPAIVSELFQVFSGKDEKEIAAIRGGADAPYALRPEFTPTLARMIAAKAAELPKPIKWFAIPGHYRAERPQRGRLREFSQWNVDFVGGEMESAQADAEVIAVAVSALEMFGLPSECVTVKISLRSLVTEILQDCGVESANLEIVLALLDKRDRISPERFEEECDALGINLEKFDALAGQMSDRINERQLELEQGRKTSVVEPQGPGAEQLSQVMSALDASDILHWCQFDMSVVRGLAYYTGTVFEIIAEGERAVAGGGRYDKLIESFGGPSLPACGFGMGDVVLGLLLHEKGLLPEEVYMKPLRPHVFVIAANDDAAASLPGLVAQLRRDGFHARHSYRSTRNVGKLLGEAAKQRSHCAIILGDDLSQGVIALKDLESGEQRDIKRDDLNSTLRTLLDAHVDSVSTP